MYEIVYKRNLNNNVTLMKIQAPLIAKKAKPGQFIMLRIDDVGERIPLTIADYDRKNGTISIIFQEVGQTTIKLAKLSKGDFLIDFVGPLGKSSDLSEYKKACVIGGGLGIAIAYPQAKELNNQGCKVDIIAGFRNRDSIILEDECKGVCEDLYITTDDGSNGNKGFVTDMLKKQLENKTYDLVIAIGPLIMMKFVCKITKEYNIKTIVSMNPIMVDGTGMCGGCRVTVGGKTKFACVDGPDFDGHLVNFDEAMMRQGMYKKEEEHQCNLEKIK